MKTEDKKNAEQMQVDMQELFCVDMHCPNRKHFISCQHCILVPLFLQFARKTLSESSLEPIVIHLQKQIVKQIAVFGQSQTCHTPPS